MLARRAGFGYRWHSIGKSLKGDEMSQATVFR